MGFIRLAIESDLKVYFADKSNVARHERTNTGKKPYGCFHCGKTFAESGTARKHERTQHRDIM